MAKKLGKLGKTLVFGYTFPEKLEGGDFYDCGKIISGVMVSEQNFKKRYFIVK